MKIESAKVNLIKKLIMEAEWGCDYAFPKSGEVSLNNLNTLIQTLMNASSMCQDVYDEIAPPKPGSKPWQQKIDWRKS